MSQEFWNQKSFVLITGASRGLGRTIAIEFAKNVGPGSVLLLLARTTTGPSGLEETKTLVNEAAPSVKVTTAAVDLGKPDAAAYLELITSTITANGEQAGDFDHAILVHNAGSLGNLSLRVSQYENLKEIQEYYTFNLFSMILLNSQFLRAFNDAKKQRSVIQISSLGALEPFKTWGYYCCGKAGRDMLMKSLAAEEPSISTLNYAPGPFESAIYDEAVKNTGDEETRNLFDQSRNEGKILTSEQTTKKLVRLLGEKKFTKGEHVDFYDVPDL